MTVLAFSRPPAYPVLLRATDPMPSQIERTLPIDPGHVRARKHYEAMLADLVSEQA